MATSIDDNAADENLYKLFGEMSVIQYTSNTPPSKLQFSASSSIIIIEDYYLQTFLHSLQFYRDCHVTEKSPYGI